MNACNSVVYTCTCTLLVVLLYYCGWLTLYGRPAFEHSPLGYLLFDRLFVVALPLGAASRLFSSLQAQLSSYSSVFRLKPSEFHMLRLVGEPNTQRFTANSVQV